MCAAVCAFVNAHACVCAVSARRHEAVQEGGGDDGHHVLLREKEVPVGRRERAPESYLRFRRSRRERAPP